MKKIISILGSTGSVGQSVEKIIEKNSKSFKIILTGGLAHLFKNTIKGKWNTL